MLPSLKFRVDGVWDTVYVLVLALVFVASVGLTLASLAYGENKVLILSDGKSYYIWARSLLLDRDIDFRNDYRILYGQEALPPEAAVVTPAGHVVDKYPVGMAFLEAPGFVIGHLTARYVARAPTDGVSVPYQIAVAWSLIVIYSISFFLLYCAMLSFGVMRTWAFGFCVTALLGTNLIHYVAKEMTMVHAAGVAVFNMLLFLIVKWVGANERIRVVHGLLLGGLLGLLFLIRNTNVLLVPVLAAAVWTRRRIRFNELMPMLGGAAVMTSLQPVSLWFLWGRLRFSTYFNESFTSGLSGVLNTLVSARHGLLVYSPWYAVMVFLVVYGVMRMPRSRCICAAVVGSFVLMAVANGTWWCWWFGYSFGNRAFVELLPALSLAAALTVSQRRASRKAATSLVFVMLAVTALNLYLWMGYLLHAYPYDGNHTVGQAYLWLRLHSPASLVQRLAH
jgi:hypothetical protein